MKVELNQVVTRTIGGVIPMKMIVTEITETTCKCVPEEHPGINTFWEFGLETGAEIDEELKWGPKYGVTGSFLTV